MDEIQAAPPHRRDAGSRAMTGAEMPPAATGGESHEPSNGDSGLERHLTLVPAFEAPDWADPMESEAGSRTFREHPDDEGETENWVIWHSRNVSPNPQATAFIERMDHFRPPGGRITPGTEVGDTAGVAHLTHTPRDVIYIPTAAAAEAFAAAVKALAELLERYERGAKP